MLKTTMSTLKPLTIPIRFLLIRMDVMAARTSLACICWWYKDNWNTSNSRFVTCKQPQLIERPIVSSTPLRLGSRFLVQIISNANWSDFCVQKTINRLTARKPPIAEAASEKSAELNTHQAAPEATLRVSRTCF